ncbi:MAG: hypothetical protein RBR68_07500 [Tenuifilaceae bacterium]|nr:hypothetical protein [Tenuifilaceae bacterium]
MEYKLKDFVPTERKIELVGLTLAEANTEGFINPFVSDILLEVNTFLVYTENDADKGDKFTLYDELKKEDIHIFTLIGEEETELLLEYQHRWTAAATNYYHSIAGTVASMNLYLEELAEKTGNALDAIKNIDMSKLAQLLPLAQELGFDIAQLKAEEKS